MSEKSDERIRIRVPESYKETSGEVWVDLEKYIYNGFLTCSAYILNHTFIFKTLNHTEIKNLEFLRPIHSSPPDLKSVFRSSFIAHSIFMIDGQNVLYERPKNINRIIKLVSKIDARVQDKIFDNIAAINERATRLYPLTEVYVHENRSRFKWLQFQSVLIHSPMATGIPGTDEIGMNYAQQTWTALNRVIDQRDVMEREWSNAKFIGSCFAGKGIRTIDEKDKARQEKDRQEREDLKMKVLYRYLNRNASPDEEPPHLVTLPDGRTAEVTKKFQAISAEELALQLESALSGEKDHHDLVIEAQDKKLRQLAKELELNKHTMYMGSTSPPPGVPVTGSSRVIGNKQDVDSYVARMETLRLENIEKTRERVSLTLNEADIMKKSDKQDG